ncbi:ABC-type Fe3+-siderophore transport system, permease component [Geoglobus ahangari]|uniref:ABC-type Fe3+-siderophore transport system, permease component n=1 Tax=Geoglobus ahangari TaxID=113653 RepID=A0A0F7DBV3_9EURY|nr:ABC-type Fe3+-siderophore transport system, permease component [Geoglobus ahangari]
MRSALLLFLFFASLASVLAGFMLGSVAASLEDLLDAISGKDNIKGYIILNVRVPRTLGAYIGGAALALSGLMLQTYFRNPLAGPYVLGISSAASLGVALYVLAGVGWSYYGLVGSSMLGSLVAILFVLVLASRVRSAVTLLIAGLMFGYVFGAVERILITFAESRQVHEFVLWTFGSFSGVTWDDLRIFSALVLVSLMLSVALAKPLNAMLLGEEYARSMGVDVRAVRVAVVTMSSFLAALVTAFAGIVAFIGLAVPHIVRMLFRTSDHRVLIPAVSVCGALITVICDIVARTIASPVELPISVVTSLFGAPIVVLLIMKRRRVG